MKQLVYKLIIHIESDWIQSRRTYESFSTENKEYFSIDKLLKKSFKTYILAYI